MQKTIKHLFPFFLSLFLVFVLIPNSTSSLSYYNWIQNPDFAQYVNVAEDGSFESGNFCSGILYGNFSGVTSTIKNINPYEGVYHVENIGKTRYNFTYPEEVLGADIEQFTFWADSTRSGVSLKVKITIHYSDYTLDSYEIPLKAQGWININVLTENSTLINPIKYVVAFDIQEYDATWHDLDLVVFRIGQIGGQETIDFYSYPWRCTGSLEYDRIGLTALVGHNDLGSGYIGYEESLAEFIQDIPYADSDDIHYFDLWVGHIATFSTIIKVTIVYSDGTHDISYEQTQNISTWQHIVFSISFDSNKYIKQVQIGLGEMISHNVIMVAYEDFGIIVNLVTVIEEFKITVEWRRYGSEEPTQPEGDVPWIATTGGTRFIVMIFMVFVPSAIIGFQFSEHKQNGLLGFMVGLMLMSSIAFMSGLMDLWFLFLMLIAFIVFIFFTIRSGGI